VDAKSKRFAIGNSSLMSTTSRFHLEARDYFDW